MFTCNLSAYNMEFLTNVVHSEDFRTARCVASNKKTNILSNLTKACVTCVREKCVTSKAIVQKVVRLTMAEADSYLERDPAVRIIHLVRDPRGILLSRMHFNSKTSGEMHNNYSYICQRIRDDIKVSREISHKHWGKILTLRYEDMAQDLLRATEIMYSFTGLEMLPSVRSYVRKVTSYEAVLPNGKTAAKQTARKNPFKTAYNWRLELPFSLVKLVDHACKDVLDNMGYLTFTSEEKLRDMSQPAKLENYGYGLMTV
ncbi:unnamed protein product [Lymnaea stagnalis]|uniref:Sulfotransferase domain-containing protein n=1 Tax=Lymnaea stagnalis TaxID=6523 RepID=A0AAV2H0A8_LYMST